MCDVAHPIGRLKYTSRHDDEPPSPRAPAPRQVACDRLVRRHADEYCARLGAGERAADVAAVAAAAAAAADVAEIVRLLVRAGAEPEIATLEVRSAIPRRPHGLRRRRGGRVSRPRDNEIGLTPIASTGY